MKQDVSEEMLIRYILKEASADEEQAVIDWVEESETNAGELEGMKIILESSRRLAPISPLTEDEAWDNFKQLRKPTQQDDTKIKKLYPTANWLRIAAAVTIFIGGGWLIFNALNNRANNPGEMVSIRTGPNVKVVTLPDGSVIHINKNSNVTYASSFKWHRGVTLSGEAFFEVKHNEQAPFTVTINGVTIKDIGTAFNVNGNHNHTEVIVESGIVQVGQPSGTLRLKANEMVNINPTDKKMMMQKSTDMLYNYYRTNQFVADNTPLQRLVEVLNEAYNQKITITNKSLINEPITVNIKREDSLATILDVIKSTTPGLHIVKTNSGFSIQ